ncbi:MAG TPA: hypothetical protein VL832_16625 [Puia sp.]|nr:hypothetical protein [Puia sp.]
MKSPQPYQSSPGITEPLSILIQGWVRVCNSFFNPCHPSSSSGNPDDYPDLEMEILKMKNLLQKVMGGGTDKELIRLLNKAAARGDEFSEMAIVWIDLIDVLVQHSEKRYGASSNKGSLKSSYVKEVIKQLLNAEKFEVPNIPDYLIPVIVDGLVDWAIDALVAVTNKYGLWETDDPKPDSLWAMLRIFFHNMAKYAGAVLRVVAWPFVQLYRKLRPKIPLPPGVQSAVDAVKRKGLIAKDGYFFKDLLDAIVWIGNHREQLVAAVQLLFETVQLTERFVNASGEEKKEYATRIILAVLTDSGFVNKGGLMYSFLQAAIETGIDVAVYLFNKRKVFTHTNTIPIN